MGTRFLMTAESPVPDAPKTAYVKAGTGDIVVSTKVDGIPQRMILNPLLRRIEGSGKLAMWARAVEAGLEMKRQTGMGWGEVVAAARGPGAGVPNPELPAHWSPTRTRLLCPHPQVARYQGGDPERAESFACE